MKLNLDFFTSKVFIEYIHFFLINGFSGGQNTIIMANITTDSNTTTYSLDNTRFTLEDLRRFLEGMDQGQEYNYQGKIASTGEPTISRQQLERRIRFLENMSKSKK